MRIKGYWDEYDFEEDEYGKPIYYNKVVVEANESPGPGYVEFICPCDDKHKWVKFVPVEGTKHPVAGEQLSRLGKEVQINNHNVYVYMSSAFVNTTLKPAEIIVNNFTDFTHSIGDISGEYNVTIKDYESPRNYKEIHSKAYKVNIDEVYRLLEYRWNGCDMSMSTNSNNIDLAFAENVDFVYHSHYDNNNKRLLFAIGGKENEPPAQYAATLEFSLHFDKTITNANGEEVIIPITVPVGKFYIAEDLNIPQPEEEYAIYNITDNSKRVKYIDTTTKFVASDTFAIDVDKNIMSYQYSQMPQYAQTELAVFLDPNTLKPFENNSIRYTTQKGLTITGNLRVIRKGEVYYKWQRRRIADNYAQGRQIVVDAKTFPGAFRLVGETYIRDRFGKEQKLQIEIPLCKLSSNTSLSLAADGDPVTVDMSLRAMRKHDGTLVKFTYYDVDKNCLVPFEAETELPVITTEVEPSSKTVQFDDNISSVTIRDTVSYRNFTDGEYDIITEVKTLNGGDVCNSRVSRSLAGAGTISVEISVPTPRKVDATYVIYETISKDGIIYAEHKDVQDRLQQFSLTYNEPRITTSVSPDEIEFDDNTGSITVVDNISYEHFKSDSYTVTTEVIGNGESIYSQSKPIYFNNSGTTSISIDISTEGIHNKVDCVVYETIEKSSVVYVEHKDAQDEEQQFSLKYNPPPAPQVQLTIQSPLDTELYCLPQDCQPPYDGKEDTYVHFEGTLGAATSAREICSILYTNEDQTPIDPADLETLIANTTITIEEVTES